MPDYFAEIYVLASGEQFEPGKYKIGSVQTLNYPPVTPLLSVTMADIVANRELAHDITATSDIVDENGKPKYWLVDNAGTTELMTDDAWIAHHVEE